MAPIKPLQIFLSALSAAHSKLFSLYFKFSGEPWIYPAISGENGCVTNQIMEQGRLSPCQNTGDLDSKKVLTQKINE